MKSKTPKLAKCCSAKVAAEYTRLGWTLKSEIYEDGDDEPCEYVFEWLLDGEAVSPGRILN
jgi:hypothetical protein